MAYKTRLAQVRGIIKYFELDSLLKLNRKSRHTLRLALEQAATIGQIAERQRTCEILRRTPSGRTLANEIIKRSVGEVLRMEI